MSGDYNYAGNWLFAVGVSLVAHIVVVTLLLSFNSAQENKPSAPEPVKSVAAASNDVVKTLAPEPPPKKGTLPKDAPKTLPKDAPKEAPKAASSQEPPTAVSSGAAAETEEYVVCAGDTLSKIAKRCSCAISDLAKLNGKSIKELSRLRVGQKIRVKRQ